MSHRIETIAAHAGRGNHQSGEPVVPSISLSSTFFQTDPGNYDGYGYARLANPIRDALEQTVAALEEGERAAAFSSGCAAMHAVLQLLKPGDHLVGCSDVYGGTYRLIERLLRPQGIEATWVDMRDPDALEASMRPSTKMLWVETPTNPLLRILDIRSIAKLARSRGALCVVDSTFATPALQRPLALGADMVVHSMSKYLNGHSDVVAGMVIGHSGDPMDRVRFIQRAAGATPSPFDCYLVIRGLKTLPIRMRQHCENAESLARWLAEQPLVEKVHYPGFADHPDHELAGRQMTRFGGMVSFEMAGGSSVARSVAQSLRVFALAESLGGVESLVGLPGLMSHGSMPKERREACGIREGLIRCSVGLEAFEDLRDDLAQAFSAS